MTFVLNLTVTCYGKQRRHFEFFGNMADRALSLNVSYYFETLLWLLDVNKQFRQLVATAILNLRQYGG